MRQADRITIPQRFTALQSFYSDETHSDYERGLSYTADNDKLAELVPRWVKLNLVKLGGTAATVSGKGE